MVPLLIGLAVAISGSAWVYLTALKPGPPYEPDAQSGFTDVGDARLHYTKYGQGPALVLVHGLGASSYIWRFVWPAWAKEFTVITLDLPGFGRSSKALDISYSLDAQAKRAIKALDLLNIREATLVGSSMGGTVALWMAHLQPARFTKVAALAPATDARLVPRWIGLPLKLTPVLRLIVRQRVLRPFVANALSRHDLITPESMSAYIEPYRDRNALAALLMSAMQTLRDPRLPGDLRTLSSRVLLLYGEKDRVVPRSMINELRKILPNVEYHAHPEAGHHPMEDTPEWIQNSVADFARNP